MSFSTELAELVTNQLTRFVTFKPHHLAGQVANLDFWLGQVRHALATLDGYGVRFVRMDAAQQQYVSAHQVTESVHTPFSDGWERTPPPPRRIPDRELRKARQALLDAAARFLIRCRDAGLISYDQLFAAGNGLGIDTASLRSHP